MGEAGEEAPMELSSRLQGRRAQCWCLGREYKKLFDLFKVMIEVWRYYCIRRDHDLLSSGLR